MRDVRIGLVAHVQYVEPVDVRHVQYASVPREYRHLRRRETEGPVVGREFGPEQLRRTGTEDDGARHAVGDLDAQFGFGGEGVTGDVVGRRGEVGRGVADAGGGGTHDWWAL